MSHLSDKELDRLSREAAEQNDVPQNASGWDSLHLRLDKEMPVNPRRQRRNLLLLLSLLALLTGSGLVYRFANGPSLPVAQKPQEVVANDELAGIRKQLPAGEKETINPDRNKEQDVANLSPEAGEKVNNAGVVAEPKPSPEDPKPSTVQQRPVEKINSQPNDGPKISAGPKKKNKASSIVKNNTVSKNNTVFRNNAVQKQKSVATASSGNRSGTNKNQLQQNSAGENGIAMNDPEASLAGIVPAQAFTDIHKPAVNRKNIGPDDGAISLSTPASMSNKSPQSSGRKFPFSLSVLGGADWTTVRFTHKDKAGYNAGLTFTWHFAKNFSVTTGAVYMKKNYSAYGEDYHPPKGYWTNYITLDEVNGSCWMIDIPLNLRYDFAGGKKSSFFGSAGASTYLMDKEAYTYHYTYNGNYNYRKWENKNNSSHVFSILNLSAGYEKNVSRNISAQIEPYLKMPVSGIGFGNMKMSSYGLNFGIRYRPVFKKQNITVPVKNP